METAECTIDLEPLVVEFIAGVDEELNQRLTAWPPDFAHIQVYEVIGGMLARQANLAMEIAGSPQIWNGHSAPILLRAMADVYINIAWLLLDPEARALKFIAYGLGQAKLGLEHRRAEIGDREPTEMEAMVIESTQRWIDSQHACFLLDVNLGKWSDLSVRKMAEEADCLDFYNFVYSPFSACAHSMWHHIARYNLDECANPLHRYHRRPMAPAIEPDVDYLVLAAKYWAKSLRTFDDNTGVHVACSSSYDTLLKKLESSAG